MSGMSVLPFPSVLSLVLRHIAPTAGPVAAASAASTIKPIERQETTLNNVLYSILVLDRYLQLINWDKFATRGRQSMHDPLRQRFGGLL